MIYFAFIVFLSAFLLFQVQPMIGKYILPWFGGSSAVWSATMLFFMALLTAGYGYAYWLINRLSERRQGIVHLVAIGASLALLLVTGLTWQSPITPDAAWRPSNVEFPIWDIFKVLAASVGLPYLLLAGNGPLMQAWFSQRYPGRSPYRLYALSNAASLLALVSYPVLVEPSLSLNAQADLWSWAYVVFAGCAIYGALRALRGRAYPALQTQPVEPTQAGEGARSGAGTRLLWIALPACAAVLLLATTSQLTQEVAAIPFLWVLPLALYLLSFILCFTSERLYSRLGYSILLVITTGLMIWGRGQGTNVRFLLLIGIYSLLLFVCCMICHGELVRLKPHPRHLTSYYLMISIGGALGGIVVNLIVPLITTGLWELPLGVLACWALWLITGRDSNPIRPIRRVPARTWALLIGALFVVGSSAFVCVVSTSSNALFSWRNFYGILQVSVRNADNPELRAYRLYHGATLHGIEYTAADKRDLPTTYYTEESGVGLALPNHPKRPGALRVGVLGLGIGTLAAYAQPGDTFRFYEINPQVVRLAEGEGGYFNYLRDCRGRVEVVLGDARIALEQELERGEPQRFDVLVLDTFNSDSIPVHLLTREGFALYLQHLQPDGILALHISNRYLDLRPVVWALSDSFHLNSALINGSGDDERRYPSAWVLATRDAAFLDRPAIARASARRDSAVSLRLWTDDYSNLFQVLQ